MPAYNGVAQDVRDCHVGPNTRRIAQSRLTNHRQVAYDKACRTSTVSSDADLPLDKIVWLLVFTSHRTRNARENSSQEYCQFIEGRGGEKNDVVNIPRMFHHSQKLEGALHGGLGHLQLPRAEIPSGTGGSILNRSMRSCSWPVQRQAKGNGLFSIRH